MRLRQLGNRVLSLREQHNLQNVEFCEERLGKNQAYTLISPFFISTVFGTGQSTNSAA